MPKVLILNEKQIDNIKSALNSICGCADHVSYSLADDETAEQIDKEEITISKIINSAKDYDCDLMIVEWLHVLITKELDEVNGTISNEKLAHLGTSVSETDTALIIFENIERLEKYKLILENLKTDLLPALIRVRRIPAPEKEEKQNAKSTNS